MPAEEARPQSLKDGLKGPNDSRIQHVLLQEMAYPPCHSAPSARAVSLCRLASLAGTTFVVKAGKAFTLLSTNKLGERITAPPAIAGDELIYRTDSHLYCIGQARGE